MGITSEVGITHVKDRWFNPAQYNMVRVLNRLADNVEKRGGIVDRHYKEMLIHTRGFSNQIMEYRNRIDGWKLSLGLFDMKSEQKAKMEKAIEEQEAILSELMDAESKAPVIPTTFVSCICDLWIRFELDGFRYYFDVDHNPFFPDSFIKEPANGVGKYYGENVEAGDKDWLWDELFRPVAEEETIEKCADVLLDFLEKQKVSIRYE